MVISKFVIGLGSLSTTIVIFVKCIFFVDNDYLTYLTPRVRFEP